MGLAAVVAFAMLGVPSPSQARGFYVDSTKDGNSRDGSSPENAWKNFGKFIGMMVSAGDTLYLARGSSWTNQPLVLYHGGAEGAPFVVTDHGDPALPRPEISDTNHATVGIGASHVVVQNLSIHAPKGVGVSNVLDSISDVTVQDMEISDCGGGIAFGASRDLMIRRNRLKGIHFKRNGTGAIGVTLDRCVRAKVLDNEMRDCIDRTATGEDGGAVELFRANRDIEIAGNRAVHTAGFIELGGLRANRDSMVRVVVHHNVAMDVQDLMWINLLTKDDTTDTWGMYYRDIYLDHNTFIQDHRKGGLAIGNNSYLTDSTLVHVRNNLFAGDSLAGFLYHGPYDRRGNVYWSPLANIKYVQPFAPGEKSSDPLLVKDFETISYRLASGSPARDCAWAIGYPMGIDIAWRQTVPDGKPDIGALESSSASEITGRVSSQRKWQIKTLRDRTLVEGTARPGSRLTLSIVDASGVLVERERFEVSGNFRVEWRPTMRLPGHFLLADLDGIQQGLEIFSTGLR
jgi:hypothetical protein